MCIVFLSDSSTLNVMLQTSTQNRKREKNAHFFVLLKKTSKKMSENISKKFPLLPLPQFFLLPPKKTNIFVAKIISQTSNGMNSRGGGGKIEEKRDK